MEKIDTPLPRQWDQFKPLLKARKRAKISQVKIGRYSGMWQPTISYFERGHVPLVGDSFRTRYRAALVKILGDRAQNGDQEALEILSTLPPESEN